MSRGDHVYVRRRRHYSHHGIDCGDGTIIHFAGDRGSGRRVERTSWEAFADGSEVRVRRHRNRLPAEVTVRNAESRLGSEGYHLVTNNCEHFATWSATGSSASSQVRKWVMATPGAMASVGVADAAGLHMVLLGSLGMGFYALAKPFRRTRRRLRHGMVGAPEA
jgi:hypothetical protein